MKCLLFLIKIYLGYLVDLENDSIINFIPEQMTPKGNCQARNSFGYPNCIATRFRNGELIFRLGSYGYTRSRANDACNAMGGYMFVPENDDDNQLANDILNLSVGNPQNAILLDQNHTESWIGLSLMQTVNGNAW